MKKFKIFTQKDVDQAVAVQHFSQLPDLAFGEEYVSATRLECIATVYAHSEDEAIEEFKASKEYYEKEEYLILRTF